jgi:protein-tyrosine phosphatase
VLFVCLGNICRSPGAEAVFAEIARINCMSDSYEIDSAGTGGWHTGELADSRMRNHARQRGYHFDLVLDLLEDACRGLFTAMSSF